MLAGAFGEGANAALIGIFGFLKRFYLKFTNNYENQRLTSKLHNCNLGILVQADSVYLNILYSASFTFSSV